jgi:glycyl-tRNA synthetase beta chain
MSTTANCLIEIGTEELPPTALKALSLAFEQGLIEEFKAHNLNFNGAKVKRFATPRRLAVLIPALDTQQADQALEKLGPAVAAAFDNEGKPTKAAMGFAKSNQVTFEQLQQVETEKGLRLAFISINKGQPASTLLATIITNALDKLPIPKRMRWGASRAEFVRPMHWLLVLLDEQLVNCQVMGINAGQTTQGHRFHSAEAIFIDHASHYESLLLDQGSVVACFETRRKDICEQVTALGHEAGGMAVIEDDLLDEVTALVEKPYALMGGFDKEFLSVPQEALIYSMSEHQKYFHIVDEKQQLIANFITVSNINSTQPEAVISGNERVIRPRLADAAFFFETDKKQRLAQLRERLKSIVFQKQLGTVFDKTERIASLSEGLAAALGADASAAKQAGQLSKADLASDMVLEFDKMQGTAGGYYASHEGLGEPVAIAIAEHYLPKYAGDKVPSSPTACAVALADRLDTLTGIFGIGQMPSGSKDPFALRRASIGVLQIILQNRLAINIKEWINKACHLHAELTDPLATEEKVFNYLLDRFAALYQDQGLATEVFAAVKAKRPEQPLDFDARVQAVAAFINRSESDNLASANKRVNNILTKSEPTVEEEDFNSSLLVEPAEKALSAAIEQQEKTLLPLFEQGNYRDGLLKLTELSPAIDAFFDTVMVNTEDAGLKVNRLSLLAKLRSLFLHVADISLLAPSKT